MGHSARQVEARVAPVTPHVNIVQQVLYDQAVYLRAMKPVALGGLVHLYADSTEPFILKDVVAKRR
jgi:hypothetical protein